MIEPVESLIYLYYRCTKCGEVGDEVRLIEARTPHARHVCMFCGHIDQIKRIEDVEFKYKTPKVTQLSADKSKHGTNLGKYQKIFKSLVKLGYDRERSEQVVTALMGDDEMSTQQLFKLAVLQLDNNDKQTPTNQTN